MAALPTGPEEPNRVMASPFLHCCSLSALIHTCMNANPPKEQSIQNKQVFGVVTPLSVPSVRPGDQILHILCGFPWTTRTHVEHSAQGVGRVSSA